MDSLLALVRRSLDPETQPVFAERVREQAEDVRGAIESGELASTDFSIGLELETYAVHPDGTLAALPASVFGDTVAKELGVHNAELNTAASRLDLDGLREQRDALASTVGAASERVAETDRELVLDAMWTIPPSEGSQRYLSALADRTDGDGVVSEEAEAEQAQKEQVEAELEQQPEAEEDQQAEKEQAKKEEDQQAKKERAKKEETAAQSDQYRDRPITVAANMRDSPRYSAIDNEVLGWADGTIELSFPGVETAFPTILCESLTASIQPHLQIPAIEDYPRYFNAAIRTLGPVLSLCTNSPFLPADLYETDDPGGVVDATPHECRIPVFEGTIDVDDGPAKVRVPRDIETPTDVVDRLLEDRTCAPFLREWIAEDAPEEFTDRFWELDHKRGTYWRWVRTVIGGQPVEGAGDGRSLRVEYRPLPTQPSVPDTVALQCLVTGLLIGLVHADHPLCDLEWAVARDCFYDVVDAGPDGALAWLTADGSRTDDPETIYAECFDLARDGLEVAGIDGETAASLLSPIRRRVAERTVPSAWKKAQVRDRLAAGDDLSAAIEGMQRTYIERADPATPFVEW